MIGIVILNYLNYSDTVECVDSIINQSFEEWEIVIVDNCSSNESVSILRNRYIQYKNINIIRAKENLGFAKGNNLGFEYLLRKNIENILVINNDTVMKDKRYLEKLSLVEYDKKIGVVGTKIIGSDGENQNPILVVTGLKDCLKNFLYVSLKLLGFLKNKQSSRKIKVKQLKNLKDLKDNEYMLHGSAIYFTEHYTKILKGFYPETFLYFEENILDMILKKFDLKKKYIDSIEIYHKEDQSSLASFDNLNSVKLKLSIRSVLIGIRVFFKSKKNIQKKINRQDIIW